MINRNIIIFFVYISLIFSACSQGLEEKEKNNQFASTQVEDNSYWQKEAESTVKVLQLYLKQLADNSESHTVKEILKSKAIKLFSRVDTKSISNDLFPNPNCSDKATELINPERYLDAFMDESLRKNKSFRIKFTNDSKIRKFIHQETEMFELSFHSEISPKCTRYFQFEPKNDKLKILAIGFNSFQTVVDRIDTTDTAESLEQLSDIKHEMAETKFDIKTSSVEDFLYSETEVVIQSGSGIEIDRFTAEKYLKRLRILNRYDIEVIEETLNENGKIERLIVKEYALN